MGQYTMDRPKHTKCEKRNRKLQNYVHILGTRIFVGVTGRRLSYEDNANNEKAEREKKKLFSLV